MKVREFLKRLLRKLFGTKNDIRRSPFDYGG